MLTQKTISTALAIVLIASLCPAEEKANTIIKTDTPTTAPAGLATPYVAEISGTDVYVRSGPGTAYYFCSKLNEPARVIVVGQTYGWSKIVPPDGSFSWISKNLINIDPKNPTIGSVNGDAVRVWAGSEYEVPMRSSSLQLKLNEGDIVTIIEQQNNGDYYKIVPPTGAHLWISSQYLKYVGPVPKAEPVKLPPKPRTVPEKKTETKIEPTTVKLVKETPPAVKPEKPVKLTKEAKTEDEKIKLCHDFEENIKAEAAKPIDQQNYDLIKKELKALADDTQAPKAQIYASYLINRIAGIELAILASNELKRQDDELSKIREKIRKNHDEQLAKLSPIDKFIITGTLKPSQIYTAQTGQKRYIIVNDTGKIQCYAVPSNQSVDTDTEKLINRKVGLMGSITSDPKSPVSLIEFTRAVEL